jgi:glycosyltransferase involved in cell wall biosynthesis
MRLWVYTFCWNEEAILPFFLRHYLDHCGAEKVVVFDNQSTDGSAALCRRHPQVEVRTWDTGGQLLEGNGLLTKRDHAWKEARGGADWVAFVDADEFLFHRDWHGFLERAYGHGYTIVRPLGYEMAARQFPRDSRRQLWEQVRAGAQTQVYSKPCLFRPDRVEEMNFNPGGHDARPTGEVRLLSSGSLALLHYKHLGWDYVRTRTAQHRARRSENDRTHGWGAHLEQPEDDMRKYFENIFANAVDVTL